MAEPEPLSLDKLIEGLLYHDSSKLDLYNKQILRYFIPLAFFEKNAYGAFVVNDKIQYLPIGFSHTTKHKIIHYDVALTNENVLYLKKLVKMNPNKFYLPIESGEVTIPLGDFNNSSFKEFPGSPFQMFTIKGSLLKLPLTIVYEKTSDTVLFYGMYQQKDKQLNLFSFQPDINTSKFVNHVDTIKSACQEGSYIYNPCIFEQKEDLVKRALNYGKQINPTEKENDDNQKNPTEQNEKEE